MTQYNWLAEATRNTFRSWMVPNVLAEMGDAVMEQVREASDSFERIEFGITINGIPVDADAFLDGVERNMRHHANARAAEIIRESRQLDDLQEVLTAIQFAAKRAARDAVRGTALEQYLEREDD